MVFGLWSSGHCLAPGLPGHCLLQQCMQRCLPGLDMVAGQSCECSFIVQSVVFGHSTKTWFKFQNDWSKSVPETVPERKPEPETTSFGTHEKLGKNCVFWVWKTEKCLALLVFSETALKQQKIIASLALTCAWAALFFLCLDKH